MSDRYPTPDDLRDAARLARASWLCASETFEAEHKRRAHAFAALADDLEAGRVRIVATEPTDALLCATCRNQREGGNCAYTGPHTGSVGVWIETSNMTAGCPGYSAARHD